MLLVYVNWVSALWMPSRKQASDEGCVVSNNVQLFGMKGLAISIAELLVNLGKVADMLNAPRSLYLRACRQVRRELGAPND
jgi:hypothetical protein